MVDPKSCSPQRIYGPYQQTIFLGCSVLSFTATAGWNTQSSEVTIELAEDVCSGEKVYWSHNGTIYSSAQTFTGADPGFTFPNIGAPVYFRIADFEYAGLLQGWTQKESPSGHPVYTVKIVDPRVILEQAQVILDIYEGDTRGLYNLLNVYGFLESLPPDCPPVGTILGAPAGGFGGSRKTSRGIPWFLVQGAVQALSAGDNFSAGFSLGLAYRGGNGGGWGELAPNNFAFYDLDITDLPSTFLNDYSYRITGPIISLAQLVDQVCQDAGSDYYVELVPVNQRLVIKVRTISRNNAPSLGDGPCGGSDICKFISQYSVDNGGDGIISDSIGRELRPEVNSFFLIGGKGRYWYETGVDGGSEDDIEPFFGYDAEGNIITFTDDGGENGKTIRLDFRKINLSLNNPVNLGLVGGAFGDVGENELRFALGDLTTFENMILSLNYPDTVLRRYYETTLGVEKRDIDIKEAVGAPRLAIGPRPGTDTNTGDPSDPKNIDRQTFFNWLSSYASDFLGKQFLIEMPGLCVDIDSDTGKEVFSHDPSTEGAWPQLGAAIPALVDKTVLLSGLANNSIESDIFKDETGKLCAMLRYTLPQPNAEHCNIDDYVMKLSAGGKTVWLRATIEPEWVKKSGGVYAAHLKVNAPIYTCADQGAIEKNMRLLKDPKPTGALKEFVFALSDQPDHLGGQQETTGAISLPVGYPKQAAVPIVCNTQTYGPWLAIGANPGLVHAEVDEGLVPWEYGGLDVMQLAGLAKTTHAAVHMQVAERGNVTVPGYPRISLGSSLFGAATQTFAGRGLNFTNYRGVTYYGTAGGPSTSAASVSSINVTVGPQGVTTSYTISTFTPVFGRFAKGNAERLKLLGLGRYQAERERRAKAALKRLLKAAENRALAMKVPVEAMQPKSAAIAFAGKLVDNQMRKVVVAVDQNTLPYYKEYNQTAIVTMDSFWRPVSNKGSASLPQMNTNNDACADQPTQASAPPPPIEGYTSLPIRQKYLDFLADPVSNTTLLDDDRSNSSISGHDVEGVARETLSWVKSANNDCDSYLIHLSGSTSYASDYRYLATRGPMVMQGWGYDLHGKPIPNASGDSGGSFSTNYNLTDKFKENWLADARDWPVAPIDLRFDRKRGVWTAPPAFRLYQVEASGSIAAGADGKAKVIKHKSDLYDADGELIDNPLVEVENWTKSTVASGDKALAYYDTADCKYWIIPAGSGTGSGQFSVGSSGCGNDRPCEPTSSCLIFNSGLELEYREVTGTGGSVTSSYFNVYGPKILGGGGDCSPTGSGGEATDVIPETPFESLAFGSGLRLQAHAVDASGNETWTDGILPSGTGSGPLGSGFSGNVGACRFRVMGPTIGFTGCDEETESQETYFEPIPFENLMFSTGLNVAPISGVERSCGYSVMGPFISSYEGTGCNPIEPAPFNELSIGSGLSLSSTGNCGYLLQGPKWFNNKEYLCDKGRDIKEEGESFCEFTGMRGIDVRAIGDFTPTGLLAINYTQTTENSERCECPDDADECQAYSLGSNGIPSQILSTQTLELGIGLHKAADYTKDGECRTLLTKILSVRNGIGGGAGEGFGPHITGIELITDPCPMIVAKGGNDCGEEKYTTVQLGTHGIDLEIPVVTGVCCSGDTLQVNFQQLTFCSGLLQGIDSTSGPVCPE